MPRAPRICRYRLPNRRIVHVEVESPVPIGFWRSVGHSFNAFFTESFLDECAFAAGQDPLVYRRAPLVGRPRYLTVLDLLESNSAGASPWVRVAGEESPCTSHSPPS